MLAQARAYAGPRVRFERGAIEELSASYDLIFSNAAFQWCAGHSELVTRLYGLLEPGGQLVAQFPAHRRPAPYDLIVELASEEPARSALAGWMQSWEVLELEEYARIFFDLGALEIAALERVYPHVLADADAIVDWQLGTVLVPYRERLGAERFAAFERTLRERTRERWPERPVFFPFRRAFIAATRPA
jgi:trans-aconitate 2-methyltransferase